MHDTPNGEVRNRLDAPAVTVETDNGARVPLADVLDNLGGGPVTWSDITGKPTTFPPKIGDGANDAAAGNHTHPGLMTGNAPAVDDSAAEDVAALVDDFNALLAALRSRGVLGGG
ncbi:hypothetical protein DEH18_33400 [Streptomyces sp. NHF165]|uniref:head fiber protein n=1 Tax=Streptomyces sp. NHF165 TaxID=2175864 RepID=UPI00132F0488|nr:head fiber protein [Streptomyces sp. NHF165]QHF97926.1 hypothetical protein DEH18_33400 [Streptomyces sp. NHF165]